MFGSSGFIFSFFTRLFGVRTYLTRFNPRSNPIITFLALPGVDVCEILKTNILDIIYLYIIFYIYILYSIYSYISLIHKFFYLESGVKHCVGVVTDLLSGGLFAGTIIKL